MKKFLNLMMLITIISSFLGSCSVEKRLYSKGYYVQWKRSYTGPGEASTKIEKEGPTVLRHEGILNEYAIIEESIASNEKAAGEANVTPTLLSIENTPSFEANETEIKVENDRSNASNLTGQLLPVKVKSKSNKFVTPLLKKSSESKSAGGPDKALLIVLCFLIPWLAVGLATNWDVKPILFNLLWSLTCIGGIIHAIIVVNREA